MLAQQIEQWGLCAAIGNLSADEEREWAKFFLSALSETKASTPVSANKPISPDATPNIRRDYGGHISGGSEKK
jgi:hypothetical protein